MSTEQEAVATSSEDVIVIKDLNKWYGNFHVLKDKYFLIVKTNDQIFFG